MRPAGAHLCDGGPFGRKYSCHTPTRGVEDMRRRHSQTFCNVLSSDVASGIPASPLCHSAAGFLNCNLFRLMENSANFSGLKPLGPSWLSTRKAKFGR